MVSRFEVIAHISDGLHQRVSGRSLLIREYLEVMIADVNMSPGTIRMYLGTILNFDDYMKMRGHPSEKANDEDVVQYFRNVQTITDKDGTVTQSSNARLANIWNGLNHFFKFLIGKRVMNEQDNPMRMVKKPSQAKDKPDRYVFTPEEVSLLLKTSEERIALLGSCAAKKRVVAIRNHAILTLLCYTGMRVSPALNIDLADINWETNTIHIKEKRDKEYDVSFEHLPGVFSVLQNWADVRHVLLEGKPPVTAFFVGTSGKRLSVQVFSEWLHSLEGALVGDRKLKPHKLRASFATNAIEATHDIHLVKEYMHHSSINTTQLYIVGNRGAETGGVELMSKLFDRKTS